MQAVILAGGLGTRLGSLTAQIPKGMAPVGEKPFLFHLLAYIKSEHVQDIVLCTGHLGEQISDYFGDGRKFGLNISYSRETGKLLGTAGALKQAEPLLEEHFFVVNGDTYLPVDYGEVEKHYVGHGRKNVMVVYGNKGGTGVASNVALDSDRLLTRYKKGVAESDLKYVDAGVLVLNRDILVTIVAGQPCSLEDAVYQPLIRKREMTAFITDTRFYDIGTPEQLKTFVSYLESRK